MGREIGKTKNTGWQVGARRSYKVGLEEAWQFLVSEKGTNLWLGKGKLPIPAKTDEYRLNDGTHGRIRVFKPGSHIRLTFQPPDREKASTIQVRAIPNREKTTIAFHEENLAGPVERRERLQFFQSVLDQIQKEFNFEK